MSKPTQPSDPLNDPLKVLLKDQPSNQLNNQPSNQSSKSSIHPTSHKNEPNPFEREAYASITPLSSSANFMMNEPGGFTRTYRTYMRPRETGHLRLRFWHSNAVDSTWDRGAEAKGGEPGGTWRIAAAYAGDGGTKRDGSVIPGSLTPFTFAGAAEKEVHPGECFYSDEIELEVAAGHDLVFSWTITAEQPGKSVPFNVEGMLATAYDADGHLAGSEAADGFRLSDMLLVLPAFIGYKKKTRKHIVLLGDSITQGVRTAKDNYKYWGARITEGLGPDYDIWNIGSGWGRAYDAAAGGPWLDKAKQADEILIVLGVNDIDIGERSAEELLGDLSAIVSAVKANKPDGIVILSTVPPFNFTEEREKIWRAVNSRIANQPPAGVDYVFDIAAVLSEPEPLAHRIKPEYMSNRDDPHPNGLAGQAIAESYLKWHRSSGLS